MQRSRAAVKPPSPLPRESHDFGSGLLNNRQAKCPRRDEAARGLNRSPLTGVSVRVSWPPIRTPGGCCMGLRKFTETRPISTGTGQAAASAAGLCVCCVQKHSAMDIIDIVASRHLAAICCRKHRYQMRCHVTTIRYDHCTVGHDTMRYDAIS